MKKIVILLAGIAFTQLAAAQVSVTGTSLSYAQNFDALDTTSTTSFNSSNLPAGWSIFEYGSGAAANNEYRGGNGSSNTGDTYSYGSSGSTERALGSIASGSNIPSYGVYFTNNTGSVINGFTAKYRVEEWRYGSGHTPTPDTTHFSYSSTAASLSDTASAKWTEDVNGMLNTPNLTDTVNGAKDGNNSAYVGHRQVNEVVNIPPGGHILLRWVDQNIFGSDDGLAIDSFSVVFTLASGPAPLNPVIIGLVPVSGTTGVAANANLTVTFNKNVTVGTGSIKIKNQTDQTIVTKTLPSSDVTISGATATIANTGLVLGKTYFVMFDSTAFDSSIYNSNGIYDSVTWKFTTAAAIVTLDSLNETFNTSCPAGLPAGWLAYSVTGAQVWGCTAYGYGGTEAMQMNGYASVNNLNEDWLIAPRLDLSSFTNVYLQFVGKKEFTGDDLHVLTSATYTGAGNPNVGTWTDLNVNFTPASVDTQFHTYTANLTSYKAQPMFVAFKYTSSTTDGARWTVDNVQTLKAAGVSVLSNQKLQLTVVGASSTNNITLSYSSNEEGMNQLAIYDITGRKVYNEDIHVSTGVQRIALTNLNLHPGMYVLKISNDHSYGVVKTIVQ